VEHWGKQGEQQIPNSSEQAKEETAQLGRKDRTQRQLLDPGQRETAAGGKRDGRKDQWKVEQSRRPESLIRLKRHNIGNKTRR